MAFEIVSKNPLRNSKNVSEAINQAAISYLGELGCSQAGMIFLHDKYDNKKQRGLIRVSNKSLDKLRATLAMITRVDNQQVIARSIGTSGVLKKAEEKYIAG